MYKIVLLRHGESLWNRENRFTGWTDVDLSEKGVDEAVKAGRLLKEEGFSFDIAFTSRLKRAIRTLWMVLDEMNLMWIPVWRSYELNERHYGALQGLDKAETATQHGEAQVKIWRRSYDVPPPPLRFDDPRYPGRDPIYSDLKPEQLPRTESLRNTIARVVPFWEKVIAPRVVGGEKVLIAAHGNSLRALVKHLENISDEAIVDVNIPTGIPLVYELDGSLFSSSHYYLGDNEAVESAIGVVSRQGGGAPVIPEHCCAHRILSLAEDNVEA